MNLLKVSGVWKKGEGDFVLHDINFKQDRLQRIAVIGETGSGKSTLLKIIAGLIQQDVGEVLLDKEKVIGPSDKLVAGHPSIAYLSQYFELQKFLTVEQILGYANQLSEETAHDLYKLCQIDHLLSRKTDRLSGGERQRIALARLLITTPKLLLLDEPFSHLDMVHKNILKSVINNISKKLKITCILVSHDPGDTIPWADKILVMKNGRLIQEGTPERIYREPADEYVAGLLGKYIKVTPQLIKSFGLSNDEIRNEKFLRSEDFMIVRERMNASEGSVTQMSFFGDHYEMEVSISGLNIPVKANECDIKIGDMVYLSLRPKT
ncbi:MAG: ABC transporter ATP-binding protein [Bacteroidia bacterium]|nr:ABC transporter ATP-binding protein [Bacteroidia bacterium]